MSRIISGIFLNEHVPDALMRVRDVLNGEEIAVIRSIDSGDSQDYLNRALLFHKIKYEVAHGNFYVDAENLWRAIEREVFTGFDEVWIYNGVPPQVDLGGVRPATSDGTDFSEGLPMEIAKALDTTHCLLVLGDGCGLNYATQDERIASRILNK